MVGLLIEEIKLRIHIKLAWSPIRRQWACASWVRGGLRLFPPHPLGAEFEEYQRRRSGEALVAG